MNLKQALVIIVLALSIPVMMGFPGCNDKDPMETAPGHYEGFVAQIKNGAKIPQVLVAADITREKKSSFLLLTVNSVDGRTKTTMYARRDGNDAIKLYSPQVKDGVVLKKADNGCMISKDESQQLCYDGHELAIDIDRKDKRQAYSLVIDKFDPSRVMPTFENAARYTQEAIIEKAITRNFANRMEFEKLAVARAKTTVAYGNLLPHANFNSVSSYAIGGWAGPLRVIGDFLPFLFPTRWMEAKKNGLNASAELEALIIMRADAANLAEGLIFTALRDAKIQEMLGETHETLTPVYIDLLTREKLDLVRPGTADDAATLLSSLKKGMATQKRLVEQEYSSLAEATGFANPEAISGIDAVERAEGLPATMDITAATNLALQRSYELNQVSLLIDAAEVDKTERTLAWIDPTGNPDGSLGAGLPAYVAIGTHQKEELKLKREETRNLVVRKIYDLFRDIDSIRENYVLAKEQAAIQQKRLDRVLSNRDHGMAFTGTDLMSALQEKVKADIDVITYEYAYDVALSRLNRLVYTGPYARLNPEQGRHAVRASMSLR